MRPKCSCEVAMSIRSHCYFLHVFRMQMAARQTVDLDGLG
jgi:hypothetical protein